MRVKRLAFHCLVHDVDQCESIKDPVEEPEHNQDYVERIEQGVVRCLLVEQARHRHVLCSPSTGDHPGLHGLAEHPEQEQTQLVQGEVAIACGLKQGRRVFAHALRSAEDVVVEQVMETVGHDAVQPQHQAQA